MNATNEQLIFDLLACDSHYERAQAYWQHGIDDKAEECWKMGWAELHESAQAEMSEEEFEKAYAERWQRASTGPGSQRTPKLPRPEDHRLPITMKTLITLWSTMAFQNASAQVLMANDKLIDRLMAAQSQEKEKEKPKLKKPYYRQPRDKRKSRWS